MKTMIIDAQFFNQPDSAYLEQKVPLSEIASDILMEDDKVGIWLTGSKNCDLDKVYFPLALLWKSSNKIHPGYTPKKHGHLVLSSLETEDVQVLKLIQNEKLPPPNQKPVSVEELSAGKERFSADQMWFKVGTASLGNRSGNWTSAVISGPSISNRHAFHAASAIGSPITAESKDGLPHQGKSHQGKFDMAPFTKSSHHPMAPEKGVRFAMGDADGKSENILFGAFRFQNEPGRTAPMRITVLLSGRHFQEMEKWVLTIPLEAAPIEGGHRIGYFRIDLAEKLGHPKLPRFELPKESYVTFVYRDYLGAPTLLE
jgi:hypothetical protein